MATDHLAKAKDYIAIAESGDSKLAAFRKAADEIIRARKADHRLTWPEVGQGIGRSDRYAKHLVHWRTKGEPGNPPFARDTAEAKGRGAVEAKRVLKDPERYDEIIPELPTRALQELASYADEVVAERRDASRKEHDTRPTAGDLMDRGDRFKPDEFWADSDIIRVNRNARSLASKIERGGGLLLGAMEIDRAFEYLEEAERLIADARAAAQEQVSDRMEVS